MRASQPALEWQGTVRTFGEIDASSNRMARALRARGLGYGAIRLDAFTGNAPSLGLYRGLGYDEVGGVRLRKGAFRCFEKGLA